MDALTLRANEAEELDSLRACAVEPVRYTGVEFRCFARVQ
jgi:hypothetical protein